MNCISINSLYFVDENILENLFCWKNIFWIISTFKKIIWGLRFFFVSFFFFFFFKFPPNQIKRRLYLNKTLFAFYPKKIFLVISTLKYTFIQLGFFFNKQTKNVEFSYISIYINRDEEYLCSYKISFDSNIFYENIFELLVHLKKYS